MINFYFFPHGALMAVSIVSFLAVIVQTVLVVLTVWRYHGLGKNYALIALETAVTLTVFVTALIPSFVKESFHSGFVTVDILTVTRYSVFAVFIIVVLVNCIKRRSAAYLALFILCAATLPLTDKFKYYTVIYCVEIVFITARGLYKIFVLDKELKNGISVLSIKQAIDSLHTGLLFCEADGNILLINRNMQKLMKESTGEIRQNGNSFFSRLSEDALPYIKKNLLDDNLVLTMPDGRSWKFVREKIELKFFTYFQISASDVSGQWNLTEELNEHERILKKRSGELNELLKNLSLISKQKELLDAKIRVHDILGQRITIFQRWIQSGELPSREQIVRNMGDLDERIRYERKESPEQRLRFIINMFKDIDVEIEITGSIPKDSETVEIFLMIIREASTNAVRHGFATRICVSFDETEQSYRLTVFDNGSSCKTAVKAGTGISGMQQRVMEYGGMLTLKTAPQFTIIVDIPRSGEND